MSGYLSETSTYLQYGISRSHVAQQAGSVTALKRKLLPRPSVSIALAMLEPTAAFYVPLPCGHGTPNESWARGQVKMPGGGVAGAGVENPGPLW